MLRRVAQFGRNQFRGVRSVFRDDGFEEVAVRLPNRPLMRLVVPKRLRS